MNAEHQTAFAVLAYVPLLTHSNKTEKMKESGLITSAIF